PAGVSPVPAGGPRWIERGRARLGPVAVVDAVALRQPDRDLRIAGLDDVALAVLEGRAAVVDVAGRDVRDHLALRGLLVEALGDHLRRAGHVVGGRVLVGLRIAAVGL